MATGNLDNFGAYKKALQLFEDVAGDCVGLRKFPELRRFISQQLAAADSICANIEEGCGRGSREEFVQFLIYARGSANEVRGRCRRIGRWDSAASQTARVKLAGEIIAILTSTIETLRKKTK
jgi:four helix bundle protein